MRGACRVIRVEGLRRAPQESRLGRHITDSTTKDVSLVVGGWRLPRRDRHDYHTLGVCIWRLAVLPCFRRPEVGVQPFVHLSAHVARAFAFAGLPSPCACLAQVRTTFSPTSPDWQVTPCIQGLSLSRLYVRYVCIWLYHACRFSTATRQSKRTMALAELQRSTRAVVRSVSSRSSACSAAVFGLPPRRRPSVSP